MKSTGPGPGARLWNAARTLQRPFLVWVLPTVALVSICVLGLRWAEYRVAASPRYHIVAPHLRRPEPVPRWWEKKFEDEISAEVAAVAGGVSMFDESVLAKVAEACRRCAWVEEVVSVEKRFPNQIVPHLRLREPAAGVACQVGRDYVFYLVDESGVRLPKLTDGWPPAGLNAPYVFGVRAPPPRAPGMRWAERSVTDAIRILQTLRSSDVVQRSLHLVAIDVTNYEGRVSRTRSEFLIHAEGNCIIEWGRAPGTDQPGELPAEEKVQKLERYLEEKNPTTNRRLDLRFAGRVVVSRRYGAHGDSG